jgi:hypothetical protein
MKKQSLLAVSSLLVLFAAYKIHRVWPGVEVRVLEAKQSSDGKWTAVVQMEIYETFWSLNDVVYAVRLKGPAQKHRRGDLVMNVPVNAPEPAPSIDWSNKTLVVMLMKDQRPQYFATPVNGVAITVQQK